MSLHLFHTLLILDVTFIGTTYQRKLRNLVKRFKYFALFSSSFKVDESFHKIFLLSLNAKLSFL